MACSNKRTAELSKIGCLDDIVRVVETSAVVNHAQLVGTQDGQVLVPTYDWANFFDKPFRQKALSWIKSMHHLTFSKDLPGTAFVKDSVTSPEREVNLLQDRSWTPTSSDFSLHHCSTGPSTRATPILVRQDSRVLPSRLSVSRCEAGRAKHTSTT